MCIRDSPIACAALAYEEFPIGEFQVNRDGPTIPLLGLSGWNHPDLVTRGGLYTRSSVFVDSFWRSDLDADPFVQAYRDATGRSPSALEANAYDIGRLVAEAARSDARSRMEFLAALYAAEIEGDVSGLTGVTDEGIAQRSFRVLSMDKDNIFEVLPKPVSEDATDE